MKRLLFIIAIVLSATTLTAQEEVKGVTIDGRLIKGYLLEGTDSTMTIKCTDSYIAKMYGDTITYRISDLREVNMYGKTFVYDGTKLTQKKTSKSSEQAVLSLSTGNIESMSRIQYPNEAIGRALKSTGSVAIGVGVPCVAAGAVLWHIGLKNSIDGVTDLKTTEQKIMTNSRLATAGICLTAIGGALTVVGIPLNVHGKKLMTMNINYTGNGVGLAMQF